MFKPVLNLFKIIDNFFINFSAGFINFGKQLTGAVPDVLKFEDFTSFAGKFGAAVRAVMNALLGPLMSADTLADMGKVADTLMEPIRGVIASVGKFFSAEGPIGRVFGMVKNAFSFAEEGSKFMGVLGSVGKIFGRLLYPLTIIMSIWDTVKGAIKGFEQEGFLGGIAGAINGLLGSLIGAPLDLLKDGVSWILGKFGFENASKFLETFSFTDLIKQAVYGLINGFIEGIAVILDKMPLVPGFVADKVRSFKLTGAATSAAVEQAPKEESRVTTPAAVKQASKEESRVTTPAAVEQASKEESRVTKPLTTADQLSRTQAEIDRTIKEGSQTIDVIGHSRRVADLNMEVKRLQNQLEREQSQLDTNRAAAGHSTIAVGGDTNSGNTNITNNVLGGGKGGQPSATNHGVGHLPAY
jgi:hypothetical protein